MENTLKLASGTTFYPFIDWIRMMAMMGIVWAHIPNFEVAKDFTSLDHIPAYLFFMDFFKFGVICFFMITGFLLAGKLQEVEAATYFKRRLQATFLPYIFAFALIIALFVFKTQVLHVPSSNTIAAYIVFMFFESALWFLPNYWVSLFIILSFKKVLDQWALGIFFLLITLIYTFYFVYTPRAESHAHALFAYVFYMWLGYFIGRNNWEARFQQMSINLLVLSCLFFYIMASLESYYLYESGFKEPMSILRIGNQLYSVMMFITLVRVFNKPLHSTLFNPRKETFGIYLYHMFPIAILAFIVDSLRKRGIVTSSSHTYVFMGWFIIKFVFCYLLTLAIVKFLMRYRLGFLHYSSG